MTFSLFLTILRARWKSALVVFGTIVALTLGISLLLPKSFTATASVLVENKGPDPVVSPISSVPVTPGFIATQLDLIQSERVARRAIVQLGLQSNASLREDWQDATNGVGDFNAWLSEALIKKLEVKPAKESNVISISYSSRDPKFSAAVVNAFVKGYRETLLELRTEPARQVNSFFDERARKFRDAHEAAQSRLTAFQREKGLVGNDERLDTETLRLTEISSQVVALEAAAMDASSRVGQAGSTPERMQEVLSNPVVAGLQADVSREEARLQELITRLGDANPQVISARSTVTELRSKLQAAVQRASGSVSVTSNVAQQRLAQLRAARDEQRAKVLKLKSARDELSVLQREVEIAQRSYEAVTARANQTGLESQMTQSNVAIVKEATPPPLPTFPNLIIALAAAIVGGLVIAIAVALIRELLDQRLRTTEDITQVLRQPLLIVMPKPPAKKERMSEAARQVQQRIGVSPALR